MVMSTTPITRKGEGKKSPKKLERQIEYVKFAKDAGWAHLVDKCRQLFFKEVPLLVNKVQ